jgi:hypothetical protein
MSIRPLEDRNMSLHYFAQYRLLISDDSSLLNLRNLADPHPRLMVAWIHILPGAWPLEENVCELVSVYSATASTLVWYETT